MIPAAAAAALAATAAALAAAPAALAAAPAALAARPAALAARPAALAAPPPAAGYDFVEHRIRQGDTLIALARRYKVPGDWRLIARVNALPSERALRPGAVLRIPVRPALPAAQARVTSWRGSVTVIVKGAPQAVTAEVALAEGDSIATGAASFATLTLPDGSQSSLPSNTRVRLERVRGAPGRTALDVRFALEGGGLDTKAAKQRAGDRFEVRTPVAVAAVRGTAFRVAADEGAPARTEVLEGGVSFAAGAASVTVPGGFGTLAEAGGVRPPVKLLPPPAFAEVLPTGGLAVRFAPVAGARGYRFDLATDAGFLDRIAEQAADAPEARFEVAAADLFVRARAVDPDGLVGMANVLAVKAAGAAGAPLTGAARCPARVSCLLFRFAPAAAGTRLIITRDAAGQNIAIDRSGLRGDRATIVALPAGDYWFATEAGAPPVRTAPERFTVPAAATPPQPAPTPAAG